MSLDAEIGSFKLWATNLGLPLDDMPNDEALRSILKTNLRGLICNLIQRVQPRQDVSELRENILIREVAKLKDQVVPVCSRSFLPKEMQMFLRVKDLKTKKSELEVRVEESRKEYETLAASIKTKNIQHMKLQQKHETLQAKSNILDIKSQALDKQLATELQHKQRLLSMMPVKLTAKNACETVAAAAVDEALKELDQFYQLCMDNSNSHLLQDAKDALWRKLRTTFADIPNFMLFNGIVRLKEEQLQTLMTLNKSTMDDSHVRTLNSAVATREPHTAFELKLMKTKAELFGVVAKYLATRHERKVLDERFKHAYLQFVDELQKRVQLFNPDAEEQVDGIISDYVVQYNIRNHNKAQHEYLVEQIELCKTQIELGARQLEDHEVLLGSIKQVYEEISTSINRIQYEMLQLNQIKQKIIYAKNMLQHMLQDLQTTTASNASSATGNAKSNFLPTKLKLCENISLMGGESFELGGDVFSSTKLDFSSVSFNNSTLRRSFGAGDITVSNLGSGGRYTLPPHLMELCTFAEMPLEKFSNMTKECAFYLSPNPLLVASRELSSTIQLAPGILLTPFGALQEVRNRIQWAETVKELSSDLKLDLDLTMVDIQAFKAKGKQQREQIAELLDKIDVTVVNTNHAWRKVQKLYDFMLDNAVRHYIPTSRCFNNQTYSDYESEFTMYYRMATVGASIK